MSATHAQVLDEERQARAEHKDGERLARASARWRENDWRRRLRDTIKQTARQYPTCRCEQLGLHVGLERPDLTALAGGCSAPHFVCPRLDALRRRLGL